MKWSNLCYAMLALLGMVTSASAGHCGAEKSCGCTPNCQPNCCRPVICKPCCSTKYTYQRQIACCKPVCSLCAPATCCRPVCPCATPVPQILCAPQCAPACPPVCTPPACAAPACGPAACGPACGPAACGPACGPAACGPACGPANCGPVCAAPAACGPACAPACAAPAACTSTCAPKCTKKCCETDAFEVAHWIYVSQTACHGKDRAKAIDRLGDKYDCVCNPEIMVAFVYALNDSDERVRYQAADEIGDQLRRNCCCLNASIVCALTQALGDCDKRVVRAATRALTIAGYDVKNCEVACNTCAPTCNTGCNTGCGPAAPVAAPVPEAAPAPAPAPAATEAKPASATEVKEPEAYFPGRLKDQSTSKKSALQNLFGLR